MNNSINSNINTNIIQQKKFNINYQITLENYSNAIKYYIKNKQIIDELDKIIIGYKEIIKDFQKKLVQLKVNLSKLYINNEKIFYNNDETIYPSIKKYIKYINNILSIQTDSFTELINDIENINIFKSNIKNDDIDINYLYQNKNYLQNEKRIMEKIMIEYDKEYDNLMNTFIDTENTLKNFFVNKRKNSIENIKKRKNSTVFEETISKALNSEEQFSLVHSNFRNCNKNYFKLYENFLNELEVEINNIYNYLDKNISKFISLLFYNYNNINKKLIQLNEKFIKDKKVNSTQKDKIVENKIIKNEDEEEKDNKTNNDFYLFKNKYLNKFEKNYSKGKYKIGVIHKVNVSLEKKNMNDIISNEFGMEDYDSQDNSIEVSEEDIYEITKTFYGAFQFIDKSDYDLLIEKKKLEIRKLTNKLLSFGLKLKNKKEFSELKPINEKETNILEKGLEKKEYRHIFLLILNNFRSIGIFEFPKLEFEIVCRFFKNMTEKMLEEKDNYSMKFIIILSQTFYIINDGKKYYIQKELQGHKIFKEKEFWANFIMFCINEEIEKIKENIKRNKLSEDKNCHSTIAFPQIISFSHYMIEFGMEKELLLEIIEPIFKEYKINDEMKQNIYATIESKSKN